MNNKEIEAISTAYEYIGNLENGVEKFIAKINDNNMEEVTSLLPLIVDGVEYIINVVILTRGVEGRIKDIESINGFLNEIVKALENEDYNLIADIFRYEVLEELKNIKIAFSKVIAN